MATNHSYFERPEALSTISELVADECLMVDPWNSLGTSQVFVFAAEASSMLGDAATVDASGS